jgi:hypothetical protein
VDNPTIFMYYSRVMKQWRISDAVGMLERPPKPYGETFAYVRSPIGVRDK